MRYRPGEHDVRRMDWNVTARVGEPHVWRPQATHELEAWVLVDDSPSMAFGTAALEKRDLAAGAAAAIGLLTQGPGNRLGAGYLTAGGVRWEAPLPCRAAAQRALRRRGGDAPTPAPPRAEAPDLARAIRELAARHPRPGVRVVVSDLVEADGRTDRPFAWEVPLRRLAARHEVLLVEVVDPRELELPDVGVLTLRDPESGRRREVATSDRRLRERYAAAAAEHRSATAAAVRAARAQHVTLRTDRDWVRDLARHLHRAAVRPNARTAPSITPGTR